MNILVTGADGFIGKKLCKSLKEHNYNVIENTLSDGDISTDLLKHENIDHIFHLAAMTYVPASWIDTFDFYRVNMLGTVNVLELCRIAGCGLTFMSTYVYGSPLHELVSEDHPANPNSPYNHSKVLGESLCEFYNKYFNIDIVILRPFNIYGYGQNKNFLIPTVIDQFMDKEIEKVTVNTLTPKRDYLYVDDLVAAMVKTVLLKGFNIYNVGSGDSYSVLDIILILKKILGSEKEYESKHEERINDVSDFKADISKIGRDLGWKPSYTIEEGLEETLNLYFVKGQNKL